MVSRILGIRVDGATYAAATENVITQAKQGKGSYVCVANVHMVMEAMDSPDFRQIVNRSDLTVPDGMPLVWLMRLKGRPTQSRVYGPTLMLHVLQAAATEKIPVGFYGGKPDVLNALTSRMQVRFPGLNVVFAYSPSFQAMRPAEDAAVVKQMNHAGVRILFVGLGCPKQELWMAEHRARVNAIMLGVGAAFDFHAGIKPQAPAWMQKLGLEWLFRLMTEPRRLWKRYLYHNPRFVVLAIADLLGLLKKAT